MTIPKVGSVGEETLAMQLRAYRIPYEREVVFCPGRKWRFDFLIGNIAVEVDGGTWSHGRHSRGAGYERDCEKINTAVKMGYKILRYTPAMVAAGTAIDDVIALLGL